jgi:hypothetical protein
LNCDVPVSKLTSTGLPISNIDLVNKIKRIMRQDKNLELPQQKHRAYFSHKK